jgi:hypothetical protein
MVRVRLTGALVTFGLLIAGGAAVRGTAEGKPALSAAAASRPAALEIFYTPPVLVRAGDAVRIPVDVVCATAVGRPCAATVTAGARAAGSDRWRTATTDAVKGLRFDVTAAATRASGPAGSGRVEFFLRARGPGGRETGLGSASRPLAFYVAPRLVRLHVGFGPPSSGLAKGRTVLSLPWGSGPDRAGLQAGLESATLGPSAFDVDARGRVHVVDAFQHRVATFDHGRLVRQVRLAAGSPADIAVGSDGAAYVVQKTNGDVVLRTVHPGSRARTTSMGPGILSQVRTAGRHPAVDLLPMRMWASGLGSRQGETLSPGRPLSDGSQLLSVVSGSSIRIARVLGDRLVGAIELTADRPFGAVPLVEPDGHDGYFVVARTGGVDRGPDRYRVLHVSGGAVREAFDLSAQTFAAGLPFSPIRLSGGHLFQMTSDVHGVRIIRYRIPKVAA